MTTASLAVHVLTSVLLALSLKAKSILSTPMCAQSAAHALMFAPQRLSVWASNRGRLERNIIKACHHRWHAFFAFIKPVPDHRPGHSRARVSGWAPRAHGSGREAYQTGRGCAHRPPWSDRRCGGRWFCKDARKKQKIIRIKVLKYFVSKNKSNTFAVFK